MRGSECLVVPWPLSIRQTEFVFRLRYSFTLLVLLYVDTGEPPMAPNLKISNKVMVRPCENNNPRQLVANQEHLQRSKRSKMLLSFACILLCFVRQLRKMPPAACANQGRSSETPISNGTRSDYSFLEWRRPVSVEAFYPTGSVVGSSEFFSPDVMQTETGLLLTNGPSASAEMTVQG